MKPRFFSLVGIAILFPLCATAQNSYEEYRNARQNDFASYKQKAEEDFAAYRARVNAEYTQFMRERWKEFSGEEAIPLPEQEPPVPPTVAPREEQERPKVDRPVAIDRIVKKPIAPITVPQPVVRIDKEPQPLPVVPPTPREEAPRPQEEEAVQPADTRFAFSFYGTDCRVRLDGKQRFALDNTQEEAVADPMGNTLLRRLYRHGGRLPATESRTQPVRLGLPENGPTTRRIFPGRVERRVDPAASLYTQPVGLPHTPGPRQRQPPLPACGQRLYHIRETILPPRQHPLLPAQPYEGNTMHIFDRRFPNDCALTLTMTETPRLRVEESAERTLTARRYPDVRASVSSNKNLMDFLADYPASAMGDDEHTKWTIFADIPLSAENRERLYPALRQAIAGKSEEEAANMIINFVQTAFVYEYDDKVWGGDRIFAARPRLFTILTAIVKTGPYSSPASCAT